MGCTLKAACNASRMHVSQAQDGVEEREEQEVVEQDRMA